MDPIIIRPKSALTTSYTSAVFAPFDDVANTEDTNRKFKSDAIDDQIWMARKFTANASSRIDSAVLVLGKTGTPAGTSKLRILADKDGLPNYKIGGDSDPITSADLSAEAEGADQTFTWTDDFPEVVSASDYWAATIPEDYIYTENVTEIRWRTDGDGATGESECAKYIAGMQPGWSLISANVGANLTVNYPTKIITMDTKTKLMIDIDFTVGSSDGLSMLIETSNDLVTWHTLSAKLVTESQTIIKDNEILYESTGTPTFDVEINKRYAKISVKALTDATDAQVGITVWRF